MSIAEKLTTVAANVPQVFDAGKRDERNRFWDSYQFSGPRTDYNYAFAGCGWRAETFKPKHNMLPIQADSMFFHNAVPNLKQAFQDCVVTLDLSHATTLANAFSYAATTELPEINCSSCTDLNGMFANAQNLVTIDKLVIVADTTFENTFTGCTALKNISIEGYFTEDINFSDSQLSVESAKNVINHLKNYYMDGEPNQHTITLNANTWYDLNLSGTSPTGTNWQTFIQDKLRWKTA